MMEGGELCTRESKNIFMKHMEQTHAVYDQSDYPAFIMYVRLIFIIVNESSNFRPNTV
jgi:hypothetical protein